MQSETRKINLSKIDSSWCSWAHQSHLCVSTKRYIFLSKMGNWLISQGLGFTKPVLHPHAWPQGFPFLANIICLGIDLVFNLRFTLLLRCVHKQLCDFL